MNLDCTSEKITQGGKTSAPSFAEMGPGPDQAEADNYPTGPQDDSRSSSTTSTGQTEEESESESESVMEEGEVEDIIKSIDEKDLSEDDCFWVYTLVMVERSKVKAFHKNKKRTWKQSKDLKKAMAKDRSFFDRRRNQPPNQRPVRAGKKRLSIVQLKKVSRCGNCGERGHWHKERPKPHKPRPKSKSGFFVSASGRGGSGFVFAHGWANMIQDLLEEVRGDARAMSFFRIRRGMSVVDTAAGQPLMGIESMNELREELNEKGFNLVYVEKSDMPAARGVGGSSKPLGVAFVPVSIGGIEGIVEFVVIQERIPPLLSIGLLKGFRAVIDLGEETMSVSKEEQQGTASLLELATGHHAIGIVADDPNEFSFPGGFLESYNYNASDFKFRHQYNESPWHDTIDALFTHCQRTDDHDGNVPVGSIDVGC